MNGDYYEGEWIHDKREGQGFYRWSDQDEYQGEWKDNMREG